MQMKNIFYHDYISLSSYHTSFVIYYITLKRYILYKYVVIIIVVIIILVLFG